MSPTWKKVLVHNGQLLKIQDREEPPREGPKIITPYSLRSRRVKISKSLL